MATKKIDSEREFPSQTRLLELRKVLLDGYELGPLDREDLNAVLCAVFNAPTLPAPAETPQQQEMPAC